MPEQYSFLTVDDIITRSRGEAIGSTTSAIPALEDTQMIEWAETLNAQFIDAAHTRHDFGGWSWTKRVFPFKTVSDTTLNGAISAGDPSLILTSASDFDSSGRICIETANGGIEFVDNESKSSNTLTVSTTTGAETILMDHADGEKVQKMYPLASDHGKTFKLFVNKSEYFPVRDFTIIPPARTYTEYGNYILFPQDINSQDVTLIYYKKPTTLTAVSDTTDIPTKFQRWAIEITLLHLFRVRRKREDIALSLQLAEMEMERALNYDKSFSSANSSVGIYTR